MEDIFLLKAEKYLEKTSLKFDFGRAIIKPQLPIKLKKNLNTFTSKNDWINYGSWSGLETLRQKIAKINSPYRIGGISKEQVIITSGATGARLLYFKVINSKTILSKPYFFDYKEIKNSKVINIKNLDIFLNENYSYLISNPNNPKGISLNQDELNHLGKLTIKHKSHLVIDSSYRGFEINNQNYKLPKHTWEFISIGKSLGMTDLRIGALIIPKSVIKNKNLINLLHKEQNSLSISISQHEQKRALDKLDLLDEFQKISRKHLNKLNVYFMKKINLCKNLSYVSGGDAGINLIKYNSNKSSREIVWNLLKKEGIYVMPGDDFGIQKHIRICIGASSTKGIDYLFSILPKYI
ncbi:MAG: pyridoxal phosphate-dependent aminotransferase [Nanoarchaeales archaeon]|nr:pyridoxal phosphate-dependent aminotransferase [Nanoarchaeales archaeon]